jgi:FixJ family two-component response regulator/class 3 adenylate cyclase
MNQPSSPPILLYVDDEPHNLVVFEAAMPEDWQVRTFTSAAQALEKIDSIRPQVIVSDQRMPGMTGVQFLEIAKKIVPHAVRIIVTGYSDEDLIVESVRKAQIFDYIRKPWDVDDLIASITRSFDLHRAENQSRELILELQKREQSLRESHQQLEATLKDLQLSKHREAEFRSELECWVPPAILQQIHERKLNDLKFQDLALLVFDLISSSRLHGLEFQGLPIRSQVIQLFTESVLRHGGWRESHSGDSAYAHFGLSDNLPAAASAALAAANEFRVGLRSLSSRSGIPLECGIGLHIALACPIHIHETHLRTARGPVTQKSFDTSSRDVDLVHRIEKLMHSLPGTNIVATQSFVELVRNSNRHASMPLAAEPAVIRPRSDLQPIAPLLSDKFINIGRHLLQGQNESVELAIITSDRVKQEDIETLIAQSKSSPGEPAAA